MNELANIDTQKQEFYGYSVVGDQPYPAFELTNILDFLIKDDKSEAADALLDHLQMTHNDVANSNFISTHKLLQAIDWLRENFTEPGFACRIGNSYSLKSIGIVGHALSSSRTLGEGFEITQHYNNLIGSLTDQAVLPGDQCLIVRHYNVSNLHKPTLDFFFELAITSFITVAWEVAGRKFPLHHVSFTSPKPNDISFFEEVFECPVYFEAEFTEWAFDPRILAEEIPNHQRRQLRQQLTECEQLMSNLRTECGLTQEITEILVCCAGDYPDLNLLAEALKMSSRTLRRRLAETGISYQRLINRVRMQMAIQYLQTTDFSIERIADLLGYTDATNFRHSFKKWMGKPPSAFRPQIPEQ